MCRRAVCRCRGRWTGTGCWCRARRCSRTRGVGRALGPSCPRPCRPSSGPLRRPSRRRPWDRTPWPPHCWPRPPICPQHACRRGCARRWLRRRPSSGRGRTRSWGRRGRTEGILLVGLQLVQLHTCGCVLMLSGFDLFPLVPCHRIPAPARLVMTDMRCCPRINIQV